MARAGEREETVILGGERRARALGGRWRDLFDGATLEGWRPWRTDAPLRGWAVEDGALARVGPGGDLVTVDTFDDFELSLEWRLVSGGNSGVLVRVTADGASAADSGPELQLVDDASHPDGDEPTTCCGALYGLYAPLREAARAAGSWNSARVLARGPELTFVLNEVVVVRAELDSADWRLRVARSKFADSPAFARSSRGHIALQDHGDPVWFRAIRVRPLR